MIERVGHTAATVSILEEFSEVVLLGGRYFTKTAINNTQIGRLGKFILNTKIV